MALNLTEALVQFPPSVPSRCCQRPPCKDPACPPCPPCLPCRPTCGRPTYSVQFQLTYTCDRSTYEPCYRPTIPNCTPRPKPIRKVPCCCLKWYDCCDNFVAKSNV